MDASILDEFQASSKTNGRFGVGTAAFWSLAVLTTPNDHAFAATQSAHSGDLFASSFFLKTLCPSSC